MRALVVATVALSVASAAPTTARADDDAGRDGARLTKTIAKRVLSRARRGTTIGPFVGGAPGYGFDSDELDLQLSFGVGLIRYDLPVLPTRERLEAILKSRVKKEIARRVVAAAAGGREISPEEKRAIARQVWDDIKAELLLELEPRAFERPAFALGIEVAHWLSAGAWDLRGVVGIGVSRALLSAGVALQYDDGAALVIPIELSVPILPGKGLRSPVIHPFLRAELAGTGRDDRDDRVLLGVRLHLDLI